MIISLSGMFQNEVYLDDHPRWKALSDYAESTEIDMEFQDLIGGMILSDRLRQTSIKSVQYIREAGASIEEYFELSNQYAEQQDIEYEQSREDRAREEAKKAIFGNLSSASTSTPEDQLPLPDEGEMDNITVRLMLDVIEYITCNLYFDRLPNIDILAKNTMRLYNMMKSNYDEKTN